MVNAGIPVVIGINTAVGVIEKAAYAFNKSFLANLLEGRTIQKAYKFGTNRVLLKF
jgi:hypothetical protein